MQIKSPFFRSNLKVALNAYWSKCFVSLNEESLVRYQYALCSFDSYLSDISYDGKNVSEGMIIDWINGLKNLSSSTISMYETVIKQALDVAKAYGIASQMPPIIKTGDDYQPHIYTENEYIKILQVADNITPVKSYPWCHLEIPMVLRILIGCGTRITETLTLQMRDVSLSKGILTLRHSKRKKERIVPMSNSLWSMVNSYCDAMSITEDPDAYLFPGRNKSEPMNHSCFARHYRKILALAEIGTERNRRYERGVCVHCIRHTFGCNSLIHMRSLGMHDSDIFPYLSTYMGHKDLNETQKYLKFTPEIVSEESILFENSILSIYDCPVFHDESDWDY